MQKAKKLKLYFNKKIQDATLYKIQKNKGVFHECQFRRYF